MTGMWKYRLRRAVDRLKPHRNCSCCAHPLPHDWVMPHDIRYSAGSTEGCPPNCPARQVKR